MHVRFLLGPAGSGKTYRCLEEIAETLRNTPSGPPLILLAPKQATFQLERQLLNERSLSGYSRLFIFSFERLAYFLIESLGRSTPRMLSSDGRLMVLRTLLGRYRDRLKVFRSTATLQGFAAQLSALFEELQREAVGESKLAELAAQMDSSDHLAFKLHDIGLILGEYERWLTEHQIHDGEQLLPLAIAALKESGNSRPESGESVLHFGGFWLDGFSELTEQELRLLWLLLPKSDGATIALNLTATSNQSFISPWSLVSKTYQRLRSKLSGVGKSEVCWLEPDPKRSRFALSPPLAHLERNWTEPLPYPHSDVGRALELYCCATPEEEAALAARNILRFIREGGRFRDIAIIVRDLGLYHPPLRHVLNQYEIPFFLDRRESVATHPLIELTLNAWRIGVFNWQSDDFFAALKTGLIPISDEELDALENEALERGWNGDAWRVPIAQGRNAASCEKLRRKLIKPFVKLHEFLGPDPDGLMVAEGLRQFYSECEVQGQLEDWSANGREPIHLGVWEQTNDWLANVELAFDREKMTVLEWLSILEAGLASQTVGLIPPALDQVLIGSIDRSRNPDLRFVVLLGLNDCVFPSRPGRNPLLTNRDSEQLAEFDIRLGRTAHNHLAQEMYFGYIAFTRARDRIVASYSLRGADDSALSPSPFLAHLRKLFPGLEEQAFTRSAAESLHPFELTPQIVAAAFRTRDFSGPIRALANYDCFSSLREALPRFEAVDAPLQLEPELAERLYGQTLKTSVSALEDFAACQFRFFIKSGLRAKERRRFELDLREQGTFQHEVLAEFHRRLLREGKLWRDVHPPEAVQLIGEVANDLRGRFNSGLALVNPRTRFLTSQMTSSLEDFIHRITIWNREQYTFDPHSVELPFGSDGDLLPAWDIPLGNNHNILLRGKIDRVDIHQDSGRVLCVVIDYKSSEKKLDPLLVQNGIQLQLLAYLNVVQKNGVASGVFPSGELVPAGVFYLSLRGWQTAVRSRNSLYEDKSLAYQHQGRFNLEFLPYLDSKSVPSRSGDQFQYRLTKNGVINKNDSNPLPPDQFHDLLSKTEDHLRRMGLAIFTGDVAPNPYRKSTQKACDFCEYKAICRINPAEFPFRRLESPKTPSQS